MNKRLPIRAMGRKAEVLIYEEIGRDFGGFSAKEFAEDLKAAGDLDEIHVRINSPGGSVFEGLSVHNMLKQHRARVIVDIDGIAASIASIIAMAGDEIHMAESAMLMIHDPWTIAMGSAEDFRAVVDLLDKMKESLVGVYVGRTGQDAQKISDLMTAETWFNASEAKELKFIDSVTEPLAIAANYDPKRFKNAPQNLRQPQPAWRLAAAVRELELIK